MKLYAKMKYFSWKQDFNIYNEYEEIAYIAKGHLDLFGRRKVSVMDASGQIELAYVKQRGIAWTTVMDVYVNGEVDMTIRRKAFTLRPKYEIEGEDWTVSGSFWQYDYQIVDGRNHIVAHISKKLFSFRDSYEIDIQDPTVDISKVLSIVLTIQADLAQQAAATSTTAAY